MEKQQGRKSRKMQKLENTLNFHLFHSLMDCIQTRERTVDYYVSHPMTQAYFLCLLGKKNKKK